MIIPSDPLQLAFLASELYSKCFASRGERMARYETYRRFYLQGAEDGFSVYNKMYAHIDLLSSYLFSGETTRFSVKTEDRTEQQLMLNKRIIEELNNTWNEGAIDITFSDALTWALVFESDFIKVLWGRGTGGAGVQVYMVEPHNIGVLREDVPGTDSQEVIAHRFYKSRHEVKRMLSQIPGGDEMYRRINFGESKVEQPEMTTIDKILISATQPDIQGSFAQDPTTTQELPQAKVVEDLATFCELWVWDDIAEDYRVITIAEPDVVVFNRANMLVKREHPFVHINPNRMYDYYFGRSELLNLIPIQQIRNMRIGEIQQLLRRQLRPPTGYSGMSGPSDEMIAAMWDSGGNLNLGVNGKLEPYIPQMPQDVWHELQQYDEWFMDMSGIRDIMMGKGEQGVRGGGHANILARMASSRVKKKAMIIEDALEKIASLVLKLKMKYDGRHLRLDDGTMFVMNQFTDDHIVKVDGHSSSPLFQDQYTEINLALAKGGIIDGPTLIDALQLPNGDELRMNAEKVLKGKAESAKEEFALEKEKVELNASKHK